MQLRDRLAYVAHTAPAVKQRPPQALPAGVLCGENEYGPVFFKDQFFPLDHLHGRVRLGDILSLDEALLARLGPEVTQQHIDEAAYLDIETTGLSGGAGTYAFLIGVGTFDGLAFRVRQFFLRDPGTEAAMLAAVADTIGRCRSIVTFNGRSFDIPQLVTRYAMARQEPPFDLPHIDLLHPARRLYKTSLPTCKLSEVERSLLGLKRYGDISGVVIPAMYFSYVRRQNTRGLPPIFEHNSLDVLSLAGFLAHLNNVAGGSLEGDPASSLALGKWDEALGRTAEAMGLYRTAWQADVASDAGGEAVLRLARLLKRAEGWRSSLRLWQEELEQTTYAPRRVRALVELAKLHEHRLRQPTRALELAEAAVATIEASSRRAFFSVTGPGLEKRIARLRSRLAARPC